MAGRAAGDGRPPAPATLPEVPGSIAEAARLIRLHELSAEELTRAVHDRADRIDEALGSFITRDVAGAVDAARRADEDLAHGVDRGPLQGIPIGIKDNIAVGGMVTTAQSPSLDPGFHGDQDAAVVARLRAAGAVVSGKTSTMEYAIGMPEAEHPFPLPRNPFDLSRWAGGSSSGSASGVAAGLFLGALGTDTGGSVRLPAAWCGVTGLKPTHGLVPVDGVVPLGFTHDVVGPMGRTAGDCRILLDALAPDARRGGPGGRSTLEGLRVGVPYSLLARSGCEAEISRLFEEALAVLADLGCVIEAVDLPHAAAVRVANDVSMAVEAWSFHRDRLRERWYDYGWHARSAIVRGALTTAPDYLQAQRVRRVATDALRALLEDVAVVAVPTHVGSAPPMFELELLDGLLETNLTSYWNSCGHPALSLPMGLTSRGLPAGLHLGAAPLAEDLLLAVGERFQAVTDHHRRAARCTDVVA